ncbi:hypothetical protein VitviT2T_024730 [Vitis vinifera]|uniref:4Fe-4S ferredoxin-type domain-containing protein n=1 Tax=Vitis vinifera TaxID=29760 RepID=A0ABY9DGM4_VITVI|nr:hypothetical protein VitviT2T_024730 [Vitis vinifera]
MVCIGCGICVKKCPFEALQIINLPKYLDKDTTHRYGPSAFKLQGLPVPRSGQVLGLVGTNGIGKSTTPVFRSGPEIELVFLHVTPSSIDVVVAEDDLISPYVVKNLTTESFHIDGGGFYSIWGTTSSLPRLCSLEYGRMVHIQGRFYCMNYNPFSVLAYDIAANNWWRIQAPMRRFIRSPSLVESRGRLIIVATVENSKLNVPKKLEDLGFASFWNNMGGD